MSEFGDDWDDLAESVGNRYAGDQGLKPRFYYVPQQDQELTEKEGRPMYKDKLFIEIKLPGNKDEVRKRPATEMDIARFRRVYKQFIENNEESDVIGTPLSEWPGVNRAQVEEMKYMNVHTVEQLVAMSDANAQGFMGIAALREKAKAYLAASTVEAGAEVALKQQKEIEELKELVANMQSNMEAPKKRGRPKKVEEAPLDDIPPALEA